MLGYRITNTGGLRQTPLPKAGTNSYVLAALRQILRNVVQRCKEGVSIDLACYLLQRMAVIVDSVPWYVYHDILRCADAGGGTDSSSRTRSRARRTGLSLGFA